MITDEIKVIDVDTHVTEPYDLFTSRVSTKKWGDRVPHVRTIPWNTARQWDPSADPDTPRDIWILNGQPSSPIGITTMAGWREWPPAHPSTIEDFDPGAYDAEKRLERMDEYGMYAHVIYPNVAGFGNQNFLKLEDPELMLACVRAYNDFLHEWCSLDPDRLLPIMAVPFWDVDETVAEINRCAKLGHKGVLFPQQPHYFGDAPMLADPHWNPVWHTAEDLGLSINFHIGSGNPVDTRGGYEGNGQQANYSAGTVRFFMDNMNGIMEILISGICHRHPKLNFVSVESGIGWVPYVLEAVDWQWLNAGGRDEHPEMDLLPSEYFKRQVYACFWFEREVALHTIAMIPDNVLYETDFPHPTSMSPGPASVADKPKDFIERNLSSLPPGDAAEGLARQRGARVPPRLGSRATPRAGPASRWGRYALARPGIRGVRRVFHAATGARPVPPLREGGQRDPLDQVQPAREAQRRRSAAPSGPARWRRSASTCARATTTRT